MGDWISAQMNTKENLEKFFDTHFRPLEEYYSFIQFYVKQNGYRLLTCDNPKPQMTREQYMKAAQGSDKMPYWRKNQYSKRMPLPIRCLGFMRTDMGCVFDFSQKKDYYMTANGFKDSKVRNAGSLSTFHNIVVDIDCHGGESFSRKNMQFIGDWLQYFLEKEAESDPLFHMPNTIVNTGRGFQLWWSVMSCSAKKLSYMWKAVSDHYLEVLQKLFSNMENLTGKVYDDFCEMMGFNKHEAYPGFLQKKLKSVRWLCYFSVDAASSKKKAGLFRVPGTFNSKTGDFGSFIICSGLPLNLVELFFQMHPVTGKEYTKFKTRKKSSHWDGFAQKREEDLTKLILHRQERGLSSSGFRDTVCLLICGAYCSSGEGEDAAIAAVRRINSCFDMPMLEKELEAYMSTCLHKKYKFSNEYMISVLEITPEEQELLGIAVSKQEAAAASKRLAKKDQKEYILKLHQEGKKQTDIAKAAGVSQSKVSRVIKEAENSQKVKKEIQTEKEADEGSVVCMPENKETDMQEEKTQALRQESSADCSTEDNVLDKSDGDAMPSSDKGLSGSCGVDFMQNNSYIIYSYSTTPRTQSGGSPHDEEPPDSEPTDSCPGS